MSIIVDFILFMMSPMPIEIKLTYLRAGTNGHISSTRNNEKQWFIPFNSIVIDVSLNEQPLFDELVKNIPNAYTIIEGFSPYSGKNAFPSYSFDLFIYQLSNFLKNNTDKVCLRPHDLKLFLESMVKDGAITALDANAYIQILPTTNTIEDKKIQCISEENTQLALEIAQDEKKDGKQSLIWLIKAQKYDPENANLLDPTWLNNFIADVPLTEFKQLFDEGTLPFWLMQAKAKLEVHQQEKYITENVSDMFCKIFHLLTESASGMAYLEQFILLYEQHIEHQLFLSLAVLVTYVEYLDNDAFIQLLNRGESCYWLLDALSASTLKRALSLSFTQLNNKVTFNALQKYLYQTKAKLDLKFLPLDDYSEALGISYDAYILLITSILKACNTFEILDLSNLKIGNEGLTALLVELEVNNLISLKEFHISNCALTNDAFESLSLLIEKCHVLKTVSITQNAIDENMESKIDCLLRQSSPVEFMRRVCSSSSIASEKRGLFNDTVDEDSDDLFIEKSGDKILQFVNEVLEKLKPILSFIYLPSEKYRKLTEFKNEFDRKRNLTNFKSLLAELVDSRWQNKQGLTNSFTVFIESIEMASSEKNRLLLVIKNQLIILSSENNINLSQAVFYLDIQRNHQTVPSTI